MKQYTILGWCEVFGIDLIDNDAFLDFNSLISLEKFVNGIVSCTINPYNHDKYKVLTMLW